MLLSHTVMSELYQEKLLMKGEIGSLSDRIVLVQYTKPPEVVAKTAIVLDKYGHIEEARKLRGW